VPPESLAVVHAVDKNRLVTGSVVQLMEAAAGLTRRGHRITVASRPGGDLEAACREAGCAFLGLPLRSSFDLGSAFALRRALRRAPADIVHVHKGRAHAVALLAAAGLGPRPLLVVNRGVSFPLDRWNRWKYRHPRVAAIVCVAEAVREVVVATGRLRPERVHVIHAGTDVVHFDPGRADGTWVRHELALPPDAAVVGLVSVRDWKGWRELVWAFATVATDHPRARLLLAACPEEARDRVQAAARAAGIADVTVITGERRDIPDVLAACDVVVDASWAGTGITGTVREGMALERAVLATDFAGNRELVLDGEVGVLVPPRDVGALADALDRLLADPGLRRRLGEAARHRVVAHFSTGHRLDRLEALYRKVLAERS